MVSSTTSALDQMDSVSFSGGGQKYAKVAQSAGTGALVAAVTGAKIRVLAFFVAQEKGAASVITFKDGTTAISGNIIIAVQNDGQILLPFNPAGWMETSSGAALQVTVADGAIAGVIVYDEVPS